MIETEEQVAEPEAPQTEPESEPETPQTEPEPESEPSEAPSTEPPRDVHPNEVRGPIEEKFNAERETLVQQNREAREALEVQHRQNLADNARAKREALEGVGLTRSGRVPSEHSARIQR